jgi:hypothetical protein
MRMKLVVTSILLVCSSLAHSEISQKGMFSCMDMKSYEVNSQCTASLITNNMQFQNMQRELTLKLEQQSPNVMATAQFFPNKMLIKVIAQKDQEQDTKLFALVQ